MSPGVDGRRGGRGPNPVRRFPPSPAQAGCAASNVRAGDRAITWSCSRAVLVAELDERRPVQVLIRSEPQARPRIRLGLAIQSCTRVVKGRRKPAPWWRHRGTGARLPVIPCLSAMRGASQAWSRGSAQAGAEEAALVERRRPGSSETVIFDETAVEVESGGVSRVRRKVGSGSMAATEDVRGQATISVCGRKRRHRETQRGGAAIEAPPGPRRGLAWASVRASALNARSGVSLLSRSWSVAVKRGFTRGAAGGHWPRVAQHHARVARLRRVRSGVGQSRGCSFVSRLQKLVRRIFPVGAACEATRGR
jgi:hypothetical protein